MTTLEVARFTAGGMELDTSPAAFGRLWPSIDIADDAEALRGRLAEDGYLFLPGYLDRAEVVEARRAVTDRLAVEGYLDMGRPAMDAVAHPTADVAFKPDLALNNPALDKVLYSGQMMELYALLFGEEVRHYDFTWFRATSPGRNALPHCDIVYMGRGTPRVLTAWTPLGDIPMDHGALMILEGSHKRSEMIQDYLEYDVDSYCTNGPDARMPKRSTIDWQWDGTLERDAVLLREQLCGRWLSTDFRMGDLLTFGMATVHASLDNHSDRIRLSSDSRYQPASEPADERWIGENPIGHSQAGKRGRIC